MPAGTRCSGSGGGTKRSASTSGCRTGRCGGAAVSLASSFQLRRHAGRDPLFGIGRRDETFRLDLRLSHRALRRAGFTPYVGWALERNRSNIPIHEYRYGGVAAGFSRVF